jgi:hypothetical protein
MNAIKNLWTALANLASSINGLAAVLDTASGRLRQQLALDGDAAPIAETVLDHRPAGDNPEHIGNGKARKARASA